MVDDFVTFFIAGQETMANALAFCFLEICKNPEISKKARAEIDRVLGERTDVTFQDVADLKYCSAIFKETLRLYPPAPIVDRWLTQTLNVDGYNVPKDSPIWVRITYII
jgi:cholesterol 24(S)-hydroxylase